MIKFLFVYLELEVARERKYMQISEAIFMAFFAISSRGISRSIRARAAAIVMINIQCSYLERNRLQTRSLLMKTDQSTYQPLHREDPALPRCLSTSMYSHDHSPTIQPRGWEWRDLAYVHFLEGGVCSPELG